MKVLFTKETQSQHRGIGYYAQHLLEVMREIPEIEIIDKSPDIIHFPFFDLFRHTLPIIKRYPTVVTIHDLTPLVMKDRYPTGIKGFINLTLQKIAIKNIGAIITDSENSKRDIHRIFGLDKNNIYVTPLSYDRIYDRRLETDELLRVKRKFHLPDIFVLNVSAGPNANKNLPMLAKATKNLNVSLVIAGGGMIQQVDKNNFHPELADLVALQEYDNIILPGFVDTRDLLAMFQLCTVYCQASLYEGFGIPVLESMAAGAVLVCSNSSSLPEIYPKETITFDPHFLGQMETALQKGFSLKGKSRQQYIEKMIKRAKEFSWNKTALLTYRVYLEVLEKK